MFHLSEPLVLGLSSGLACLTSCGALLFPWLSAEKRTFSTTLKLLSHFLGGRLLGYLGFAALSWSFGWFLARHGAYHAWVLGSAHLIIAVMLFFYALTFFSKPEDPDAAAMQAIINEDAEPGQASSMAASQTCGPTRSFWPWRKEKKKEHKKCNMLLSPSVMLTLQRRLNLSAPFMLGLLTGMNICPPFMVAMLRVVDATTFFQALLFFFLFFLGTLPWFLPCLISAPLRKVPGLTQISRVVLLLLSSYYAYLGVQMLMKKMSCGSCNL